jgi:hypothetical protein
VIAISKWHLSPRPSNKKKSGWNALKSRYLRLISPCNDPVLSQTKLGSVLPPHQPGTKWSKISQICD